MRTHPVDRFLKNQLAKRLGDSPKEREFRSAYGRAASLVGIGCNALLFGGKLFAGLISGSIAIMADAVNNLSDASSSLISLLGFKLADKPADAAHPYGHGRYEYLSALTVSVMILAIGIELLLSSVRKIASPDAVSYSVISLGILVVSILVKLWMAAFYRRTADEINSSALAAASDDSRNDVITTGSVLIASIIAHFTGLVLDGWVGAVVAVFILISGIGLVRETVDPMLGKPVSREQMIHIRERIQSYPGVLGTHDLLVHDYGPGRQFASVHVEMSASVDPLISHDIIDNIERDFLKEENLHLVIHYDPIVTDDPRVEIMARFLEKTVREIDPSLNVHDIRIVPGASHVNIVFDCVMPYGLKISEDHIRERVSTEVQAQYPNYFCVMTLEHSFIETE